jgi:hypothetical protein
VTDIEPAKDSSDQQGFTLALLDKTLAVQAPLVERHIARLRHNRPNARPREIVRRLNMEFRAATMAAGAGVGAAAASPKVGTGVARRLEAVEAGAFLDATVLYILARANVQGIPIEDVERRRTLFMAVMVGDAGATGIGRVAERTGQHWAKRIVKRIPMKNIYAVNDVLGPYFFSKYDERGTIVLGSVIPAGIGAVIGGTANGVFSQGIIKASDRAFGAPPEVWED